MPLQVADVEPEAALVQPTIEIEVGDVRIRVTGRVDAVVLRDVLAAVRR